MTSPLDGCPHFCVCLLFIFLRLIVTYRVCFIYVRDDNNTAYVDYMDPDVLCVTMDEWPLPDRSTVTGISTNWRVNQWLKLSAFFGWFMHVVCQRAFGLLEIRFQRPWFRILHSAEEDNYSPSESISFPCCQCIKIGTNKHVSVLVYVYI